MIPKIIHYFYDDVPIYKKSTNPTFRICYTSWKQCLPDYEFKLWHVGMPEFQEMLKQSQFLRICFKEKMWAFIADYVRHYALYNCGGIYLDTDVQVLKSLNPFLNDHLFLSIEGDIRDGKNIPETAVIGAEKGHPLIKKTLDLYNSEEVFKIDYLIDPVIFGKILFRTIGFSKILYTSIDYINKADNFFYSKNSCTLNDYDLYKSQLIYSDLDHLIKIYPSEYFCPTYSAFSEKSITEKTIAIHWNNSSWWKDLKKMYLLQSYRYRNPLRRLLYKYALDISRLLTILIINENIRKRLRVKLTNYLLNIGNKT